jgi:hypothetical protein
MKTLDKLISDLDNLIKYYVIYIYRPPLGSDLDFDVALEKANSNETIAQSRQELIEAIAELYNTANKK